MIVVEKNSKLVGFLQLIYKNKKTIIIDLIAVDKKNRGKGIAKDMIAYAYAQCLKNSGTIKVGTQLSNTESIKLYLKLGFNFKNAYNILHLHK